MSASLSILIVDDEVVLREDLARILTGEGYQCFTAGTVEEAWALFEKERPELVLCDIYLPDGDGLTLLERMVQYNPEVQVIILTGFSTVENAVESFRRGAADYILKPIVVEDVLQRVKRVQEHWDLLQELKTLRRELREKEQGEAKILGESPQIKAILELIERIAPAPSPVLLEGETGVGKELVARTIHERSGRTGPFLAINCAGFPETLLESELFGYNRGAFTGANQEKPGFFESAAGGTLFLDEITEIPLHLQSKLLRVLESREFFRLGSTRPQKFTGRIIASTNKEITRLVKEGKFRDDLFYRIATFLIKIPPLRERPEDIPILAEGFARRYAQELKKPWRGFSPEALRLLKTYPWPGNARELRNVIERAMILCEDGMIRESELIPLQVLPQEETPDTYNLARAVARCEEEQIRKALKRCGGNKKMAAELLGINLATLYRKMHELGLLPPRGNEGEVPEGEGG